MSNEPLWDWHHNAASNLLVCAMNESDMKKATRYVAIALVWTSEVNVLFEQALYNYQKLKTSVDQMSRKVKLPHACPQDSASEEVCQYHLERCYYHLFLAFKQMITSYDKPRQYSRINQEAAQTHMNSALNEIMIIVNDNELRKAANQKYCVFEQEDIIQRMEPRKVMVKTSSGAGIILRDLLPYHFNQFVSHLITHRYEYQERGMATTMSYEEILEDPTNIKFYLLASTLDPKNYLVQKRIANHYDTTEQNLDAFKYFSMAEQNMPIDETERAMIIYKKGSVWVSAFEQDKDRAIAMVPNVLKRIGVEDVERITIKDILKVIKNFMEQGRQAEKVSGSVDDDFPGKTYLESAIENYQRVNQNASLGVKQLKQAKQCLSCGKQGTEVKLKMCTTCGDATYCNRECQVADWPRHKKECKKPGPDDKRDMVVIGPDGFNVVKESVNGFKANKK